MKDTEKFLRGGVPCAYCGHQYSEHWDVYDYGIDKPKWKECIHGLKFEKEKRHPTGKACGCLLKNPSKYDVENKTIIQ